MERRTRALLVKVMKKEEMPIKIHCQFVGPVHLISSLEDNDVEKGCEAIVRIGDTEGTREIEEKLKELAMDSVQSNDVNRRDIIKANDRKGSTRLLLVVRKEGDEVIVRLLLSRRRG